MEEKEEKSEGPDLKRIGLFKEMGYLHGSGYVPYGIAFNEESKKGKQMMTTCTKEKSGTQDGYFDKNFPRSFEGEAYTDRIRIQRLYRLEQKKKIIGESFKPTSPTKKPSGLGSNYGTLADYAGKIEHFSSELQERVKQEKLPRNFLVNPPKKGTGYGYADVTMSKFPPYFLEEEYEERKSKIHEPKKVEKTPMQPFLPGGPREYFDPNPFKVEEPQLLYTPVEKQEKFETPFIPPNLPKKDGGMKAGCFDKFPEYKGDPLTRIELTGRGVKSYVNKENKMFLPVPAHSIYPIRSIIEANVMKTVNSQNCRDF